MGAGEKKHTLRILEVPSYLRAIEKRTNDLTNKKPELNLNNFGIEEENVFFIGPRIPWTNGKAC
jgi:hypothetical protein